MSNKSKNVYQGMNVQRIHRSELDDHKLRDLAREDNRLSVNLKTVERARHVMLKSMDADKQLFIKSGAQSNNKISKSNTYGSSQKMSPVTSSSKLLPDQKVKRQGSSELSDPPNSEASPQQATERQKRPSADGALGSVYDHLFENNEALASIKKSAKPNLNPGVTEGPALAKSSNDRIKLEETGCKPSRGDDGIDPPAHDSDEKSSEIEPVQAKDLYPEIKRPSVWEALSTPKHISMTKAKRTQVEREFTRPTKSSSSGAVTRVKFDPHSRQPTNNKVAGQSSAIRKS